MQNEYERRAAEYRAKALAAFPYKLVTTSGDQAYEIWRDLKSKKQGIPIVLGGDESLDNILTPFGDNGPYVPPPRPVEEILARAEKIQFPADLSTRHLNDDEDGLTRFKNMLASDPDATLPTIVQHEPDGSTHTFTREETIKEMMHGRQEPPLGEWPKAPSGSPGLSVATNILTGEALPKVYIVLLPTDDWTAAPAYLRWGGWNDNPPAEYHVAAFRKWRDAYHADLVGMAFDTLNLKVARRPKSRDEALALAREQYVYCSDIVDQGVGSLRQLAFDLMSGDWWYFWWD